MDLVAIYRGPYCHSMYNACPPCRNGTYIPWRAWFQRREVDLGDGFSSEIWYVCSLFSNMFLGGFEKGVKLCMKNVPWTIRMKKSLVSSVVSFSPRSLGKIPILTMFQMGWFNHHQEIPCFCSTSKTNRLTLPSEFPMIFQWIVNHLSSVERFEVTKNNRRRTSLLENKHYETR